MKTSYKTCISLVIAVLICVACSVTVHAHKVKSVENVPAAFGEAYIWKKVDPHLQQAWLAAKKSGAMDQRFQCFARVRAPGSQGDENFLQSKGFNVRIFAGTVARGSVTAEKLPAVAALPFVQRITLATSH